jgi:hypothetical protein
MYSRVPSKVVLQESKLLKRGRRAKIGAVCVILSGPQTHKPLSRLPLRTRVAVSCDLVCLPLRSFSHPPSSSRHKSRVSFAAFRPLFIVKLVIRRLFCHSKQLSCARPESDVPGSHCQAVLTRLPRTAPSRRAITLSQRSFLVLGPWSVSTPLLHYYYCQVSFLLLILVDLISSRPVHTVSTVPIFLDSTPSLPLQPLQTSLPITYLRHSLEN